MFDPKPGKRYVSFTVMAWYQEDDGSIHLTSNDIPGFHTTINDKAGSKRSHPNMFMKLRKVLADAGKWDA